MDSFFASVEQLRAPELKNKPVIVGGSGPRGVVASASYEARHYGIRSAMAAVTARRLCPSAVFVAGNHDLYRQVSDRIIAIFKRVTPLVEPLSLDEAFLDVSGAGRRLGTGEDIAGTIRDLVWREERLTCSVGVGSAMFLAKLATNFAKPKPGPNGPRFGSGIFVVEPGRELEFLHPLPVEKLWGVGPSSRAKLDRYGVKTVGELAAMPRDTLERALGKAHGGHLHDLANGIDERDVHPDAEMKSISQEVTFEVDRFARVELESSAVALADGVAARLRASGAIAKTINIKVRFSDFATITRQSRLDSTYSSGPALARAAKTLLAEVDVSKGVRLLGVGVSNFGADHERSGQMSLLDSPASVANEERWQKASEAIDDARARFGSDAIGPASRAVSRGVAPESRGEGNARDAL